MYSYSLWWDYVVGRLWFADVSELWGAGSIVVHLLPHCLGVVDFSSVMDRHPSGYSCNSGWVVDAKRMLVGRLRRHIWALMSLCLMWLMCGEWNDRHFDGKGMPLQRLKSLFLSSLQQCFKNRTGGWTGGVGWMGARVELWCHNYITNILIMYK